jgi:hypothetical protein
MPHRAPGLVPAHLYMAVSWRYQREVTYFDRDMVEQVPLASEAPQLDSEFPGLVVPMPSRGADILLHCAEIAFENYRITTGRRRTCAGYARIRPVGKDSASIDTVSSGARRQLCAPSYPGRSTTPGARSVPDRRTGRWISLHGSSYDVGERAKTRKAHSGVGQAVEEWLTYAAFAAIHRVKKTLFE